MMNLISVATYNSRTEAEMAKGLLQSSGIKGYVSADDGGGAMPQLAFSSGVRLLVNPDDEGRAREVLESPQTL